MTVGKVDEPVILWLSESIEDQSFGYNPVEGGGQYSGNKPDVSKDQQSSNMHHQDADQIPEINMKALQIMNLATNSML